MKKPKSYIISNSKKGFTLIEILVTMTIIATLAGVGYQTIMNMMVKSDRLETLKTMKALEKAVDDYYTEYGHAPSTAAATAPSPSTDDVANTDEAAGKILLGILMAKDDNLNKKQIEFFTADEAKVDKNGVKWVSDLPEALFDKYGRGYSIKIDYDYDNSLTIPTVYGGGVVEGRRVIIWNAGRDGIVGNEDDLKSWED